MSYDLDFDRYWFTFAVQYDVASAGLVEYRLFSVPHDYMVKCQQVIVDVDNGGMTVTGVRVREYGRSVGYPFSLFGEDIALTLKNAFAVYTLGDDDVPLADMWLSSGDEVYLVTDGVVGGNAVVYVHMVCRPIDLNGRRYDHSSDLNLPGIRSV